MPRPNPRQASYLNRHSGSAHFYYIRRIPAELRPKLVGELRVEPGNRRYTLRGQLTIKVSLGTSDPRLAEKRMRIVNGDVQRILEAGTPHSAKGHLPLTVSSLSPFEIKALADEHYRALLAIDDEVSIDPRCDPQGLRSHAAMAGEDVTSPEFRIADRWATWVEFMSNLSAEDLKSRNLERYDRPIELDDEDGSEVRIDSIVDALLARHGLVLDHGSLDHKRLSHAVMFADARAWSDILKRFDGNAIGTPASALSTNDAPSPRIREVFQRWAAERKPPPKTESDFRAYVERFVSFAGDLPVGLIDRKKVIAFKDALLEYPARPPASVAKKRFADILEWARAHPDVPRLSEKTINEKVLGGLSAVFGWAVANDLMPFNPRAGVRVATGKVRSDGRLPYDLTDLRLIFSSPIYTGGPIPEGGAGAAAHWLPLLGLFTGARLEEIGQLRTIDVKSQDGVTFLDMMTVEWTATTRTKRKNNASRRRVPIHPELVACGFLAFVDERRAANDECLFPLLASATDQVTASWSKWWGRYARALGITDKRKVFHSFRHLVSDILGDADIDFKVKMALMGHSGQTEADKYGQGFSLRKLDSAMRRLEVIDLNISYLYFTGVSSAER